MSTSFVQSIADACGVETSVLIKGYKYTIYRNEIFVLEGHKSVLSFSHERICFATGDGVLQLSGNNLMVKCMQSRFVVIVGKIDSVEVIQ